MSIDVLALQELRETLEEILDGRFGPMELDHGDARLILALMDAYDSNVGIVHRVKVRAVTYSPASRPQYHVEAGAVQVPGPGWFEVTVRASEEP